MAKHVIWDWNGTLFDDLHIVVTASNVSCEAVGGPRLTVDEYRAHQVRPLTVFYEKVVGRSLSAEEWQLLSDRFYGHYNELMHEAELAVDARSAMDRVAAAGTQSLLSMWLHDELHTLVEDLGVQHYFVRVDGAPEPTVESKLGYMERHVASVQDAIGVSLDSDNTVVIGDSADDGRAARELGLSAVLVTTGAQRREDLEATDWPVTDSLTHAVEVAGFHS